MTTHMIMKSLSISIMTTLCLILVACNNTKKSNLAVNYEQDKDYSEVELYKPNFHFTPESNWMNDPNGMFYLNGVYHLFFQYYPEGNTWGPMHWGHATTKDLISWEEQPIALYPDSLGYIFSGSAVVDKNNTSGFGDGNNTPIVAIFTYHDPVKEKANKIDVETQGIAYSLDEGKTWTKHEANPVLLNPGIKNFRDPKVTWDEEHNQWLMVLAADDISKFYTSSNLKDWKFLSDFGENLGAHGGVWECPDFFPMTVEGSTETKWVLLQSLNPGGPNGGSATQYFIGDFDGTTFKLDTQFQNQLNQHDALWLDFGKDNYASVTWDNTPNNEVISIGWMSNWLYAQDVPTVQWRSSMTIPRKLKLVKDADGYTIISSPIAEIGGYFKETVIKKDIVFENKTRLLKNGEVDLTKSVIDIELTDLKEDIYSFSITNDRGDVVKFGIDNTSNMLFLDRSKSGIVDFSDKFSNEITKVPLGHTYQDCKFQLVLDKTSIEIFFNDGEKAITEIFFPTRPFQEIWVESSNKDAKVKVLKANELKINQSKL